MSCGTLEKASVWLKRPCTSMRNSQYNQSFSLRIAQVPSFSRQNVPPQEILQIKLHSTHSSWEWLHNRGDCITGSFANICLFFPSFPEWVVCSHFPTEESLKENPPLDTLLGYVSSTCDAQSIPRVLSWLSVVIDFLFCSQPQTNPTEEKRKKTKHQFVQFLFCAWDNIYFKHNIYSKPSPHPTLRGF